MVRRSGMWLALATALSIGGVSDLEAQRTLFRMQSQVASAPGSDTRAAAGEVQAFFNTLYEAQRTYEAEHGRYTVQVEELPGANVPQGISFTLATGLDDEEPWYTVAALHEKAPGSTWRFSNRQDQPQVTESTGRVALPQQ